ncbi:MAG TPA: MarR family transcriptional regulator, partial [Cyanophyceae cyanobacterium]
MTQRIEGKFYPLQHDEWVRACQELTPAQRDVLYFVRTLDPYGEGLDVSIANIARALSTKKKTVHRS